MSLIRKYFDIGPKALATTDVYSGGATSFSTGIANQGTDPFLWLTQLSQSDDSQGRVGQSIAVETLDVRVEIIPDNSLAGHSHLRMMIVADNEGDGAAPSQAEILLYSTIATGATESFLNPTYFGRFNIIEDKNWRWYNSSTLNSFQENEQPNAMYHESHHDMKSHRVMWDITNSSAITNATKGHIFVLFFFKNTNSAVGGITTITTTNPPGIVYHTRIRYRDL